MLGRPWIQRGAIRLVCSGRRSYEKGKQGEEWVEKRVREYLSRTKSPGVLKNMSRVPYHGDFHWITDQFRCLIEVKNCKHVHHTGMMRFQRDIYRQKNVNCAIMFILEPTTCIPKGRKEQRFHLTYDRDIPVLYIDSVLEQPGLLDMACDVVQTIRKPLVYPIEQTECPPGGTSRSSFE